MKTNQQEHILNEYVFVLHFSEKYEM
jgi:hypothetical protein